MAANAAAALDLLKTAFPDQVTTPNSSSDYETALAVPWSQTCWTSAAGYVHLSTAQEVGEALAIVKKAGCKFAVRSTGHNPNVGFSSADETGVVLDIRRLQAKDLGEDGVAHVGAGNTWGEVYAWLEEQKLSAIGGRDRQVGLSGFLLGGGMGALPNLHGLGADGIKNVEASSLPSSFVLLTTDHFNLFKIVLADGTLTSANANKNADLYRALKGGGSNFGIVTRFDLETHPLLNIQYTVNLYNPEDYIEINKATAKVQEAMETDPKIGLFTNFNAGFVAVGLVYADTPDKQPEAFAPFHNLTSLLTTVVPTTNGTLSSLAEAMGHPQQSKKRHIGTLTTKVSEDLYAEVYKSWRETCKDLPEGAVLHYTIQPVGTACVKAGEDRGGNIMGLESVPQCWWVFTCEWPKDGSDDAAAQRAVDSTIHKVQKAASTRGLLLDFLCMSFATAPQPVLRSYGTDNGRRLQEAAAKYDNGGLFQKLQNDGFLLRNSL